MNHAVSLSVPCLGGTSKPYYSDYSRDREPSDVLDTKTKVALVVSTILAVTGLVLLQFLPPVGGACLVAAWLGFCLCAASLSLANPIRTPIRTPDSALEKLEKLEAAKHLAAGIEIPPALQQELEQIIPAIDAIEQDHRIASIHYNCDQTATFTLKTAPDLQFRISAANPGSRSGCNELLLARRYENTVYAQEICHSENYDSLLVPPIKPIYLNVGGLRRSMLVEKVVQSDALSVGGDLERAVRQMVQFLLKTGGTCWKETLPFLPIEGSKLALQNLHHLTEDPHPNASTRESLEVRFIIDKENSLLASLNREDLIDIALDELKKLRSIPVRSAPKARLGQIQRAREFRLNQIHNPEQINVQPQPIAPPNVLGISPEELDLDLSLKDYAVIQCDGTYSDGICRIITLGEVAQAIIDRINRKLQTNPANDNIEFTPEDMLIGEKLPSFTWEKHYQYNMLQGLGYREWPDPNKEPPYWMTLVLQSLKNKNLITDFTVPRRSRPRLRVNLAALAQCKGK